MRKIRVISHWTVEDAVVHDLVDAPAKALMFLADYRKRAKEHLVVLFLNVRHHVIGLECVSVGTLTASLVHPREVFRAAIAMNAAAIIMAHNHPSGDAEFSAEDREATRRIAKAGELLGIMLIDSLVITQDGYCSAKERGIL